MSTYQKKLKIGEKVYVTQLASSWIQIAEKKEKYKVIGWINAENILINNLPLLADEINIIKRGIILVDPGEMADMEKEERNEILKEIQRPEYYSSPNLSEKNSKKATEFEIRYVYKSVINDRNIPTFLLGSGTSFSGEGFKSDLQGWIPNAKITLWNSRLCLESVSEELNPRAYDQYTDNKTCGKSDTNYVFWDQKILNIYNRNAYENSDNCEQTDYIEELKRQRKELFIKSLSHH